MTVSSFVSFYRSPATQPRNNGLIYFPHICIRQKKAPIRLTPSHWWLDNKSEVWLIKTHHKSKKEAQLAYDLLNQTQACNPIRLITKFRRISIVRWLGHLIFWQSRHKKRDWRASENPSDSEPYPLEISSRSFISPAYRRRFRYYGGRFVNPR